MSAFYTGPLPLFKDIEAVCRAFGIDDTTVPWAVDGLIRGVLDPIATKVKPERFGRTQAWYRSCAHNPPRRLVALHAINDLLGGCGIEGFTTDMFGRPDPDEYRYGVSYVNTGDTYGTTIMLVDDARGARFEVSSWGDYVEAHEADGYADPDGDITDDDTSGVEIEDDEVAP